MEIRGRRIGSGAPCFVIAEAGVNHNGELDLALRLVDAAAEAGADAVKFQTWETDLVIGSAAPKAGYQLETTDPAESQRDMVRRLELPAAAFAEIQRRAVERGILFMSSPFDAPSVALLDRLDVPAIKVGSGELTNVVLLREVARTGRPVLLSTGMSTLEEVAAAVAELRAAGASQLALLHCVSSYPAPAAEANLRAMHTLAAEFDLPVGFSDHTLGVEVAIAAAALGAQLLEKHLTLDPGMPGPDHRASLSPEEFSQLVRAVRAVESALGSGEKRPMPCELDVRRVARRSLVAARPLPRGAVLGAADLSVKRPGTGLPSRHLHELVGRRLRRDLAADELIGWQDLTDD